MVAHYDIVGNVFFEFWKIDSREKGGKGIESVERVHDRIHDAISEASFERCAPLPLVLFWPESLKKSFIVNFSYPHLISSIRQSNLNIFLFFFFLFRRIIVKSIICTLFLISSLRKLLFTRFNSQLWINHNSQIFVTIWSLVRVS